MSGAVVMLHSGRAIVILLLAVAPAAATPVADLYSAEAIVTGTEEPERTRGFRAGLVDAVVKLTGDFRLADDPRLRPLLKDPHRFVDRFEYKDRMKGIPVHDEQGTRERPHFLRMHFKPDALDAGLAALSLMAWGNDRPLTAIWLGVRTATGTYVLASSGSEGYGQRAVFEDLAKRRGIPVRLPPADRPSDTIAYEDIAAGDVDRLKAASADADAILSGTLETTPSGYWTVSWRLDWKGRFHAWALHDVTFDTAIKDALQQAALIFSGRAPL